MASDFVLTEESAEEIVRSVRKGIEEIEYGIGNLYQNGTMKKIHETEVKTLIKLNGKFDRLKDVIEYFQCDLEKVCSKDTCQLEVPERRAAKGGQTIDRDSGYTSDLRLSLASNTSGRLSQRLSKADAQDLQRISSDEAELYNPSSSGSNSSFSDDREDSFKKPEFYIKVVDSETYLNEFGGTITRANAHEDETVPKVRVGLTNENNQVYTGPDNTKECYKEFSAEVRVQSAVKEENNHATESDTAKKQTGNTEDKTGSKFIGGGHDDTEAVVLNNLSKRSSEEDNTKYAAGQPVN